MVNVWPGARIFSHITELPPLAVVIEKKKTTHKQVVNVIINLYNGEAGLSLLHLEVVE